LWLPCVCSQAELPAYARKKGRFHKGSCVGLRAWAIGRLVEVKQPTGASSSKGKAGSKDKGAAAAAAGGAKSVPAGAPSKVLLQRYYRPEDVGKDAAYRWGTCRALCVQQVVV
jgi:hypothetical protein